jgi:uncharacterized protein (DUF2141 family)
MRWVRASEEPHGEGSYIVALRPYRTKQPQVTFCVWTTEYGWANNRVTHWMPIPELPYGK